MKARVDSVTVKIYRLRDRKGWKYICAWREDGKRIRKGLSTKANAEDFANRVAARLSSGLKELTQGDIAAYKRTLEILQPTGTPIELAAAQYAEAVKRLKGVSILDAVTFYESHHTGTVQGKTIAEAVREFIAAKESAGRSVEYLKGLRKWLLPFSESCRVSFDGLHGSWVAEWIAARPGGPRTHNNYRGALVTFFIWCQARKYLPRGWEEMEAVEKERESAEPIEIFTPAEFRKILDVATEMAPKLIPFLTIGAFAGVRSAEISRLEWCDINGDYITVDARKAKKRQRRLVPIQPNLRAWLAGSGVGHVCPYRNVPALIDKLPVTWKHNALRHSYISYRLALVRDVGQVALEAGNSPQEIFRSYRELVTPEQAAEWFSITPQV